MKLPLKEYWNLLIDYLKPQRTRVTWLAIALFSSIGLQILNPQILRYFIDTAMAGGSERTLVISALLFTSIALIIQALSVLATYLSENVAWTATNALRVDLTRHCVNLDLSFHKLHLPGELVERIDGDVNALSRFFSQLVIYVIGNVLLLLGVLAVLFYEDWRAGLGFTLFSFTALVILVRLRLIAIHHWTIYRRVSAEFFGFVAEHLAGQEDIRANGAVAYVMRRFYEIQQRWLPVLHRARLAATFLITSITGLFAIGNAIALAVGAYLWNRGFITIGTVYLIFYYTNLLSNPIEQIRSQLEDFQRAEASIYRIRELFRTQSKLGTETSRSLQTGALSVDVSHLWFHYDDRLQLVETDHYLQDIQAMHSDSRLPDWILKDLSFSLPAGQVLGVLGHTGSGKTSLARLLTRFYDPQKGLIRLGGVPLSQISVRELPHRVGLVTQDVQLFQTTIRNNLTFFNPTIRDAQLWDILVELGIRDWIKSLPGELDTQIGSDGIGLSAGQAQLLAFARVFLKNPGLIILDEASSRLDFTTEVLIERAISRLLQNRTGIIIAHRLATVQRANCILILDQGHLVEYGDREALANHPRSRFSQLLTTNVTDVLT
jgi:ATP-binding cassette subfamily B protein/ATP-binding cassette subfamily C protein